MNFRNATLTAIKALHDDWVAAELSGDIDKIIELCTDDARLIPPDSPPVIGKQAIAQYLRDNSVSILDIRITDLAIRGSGTIAYLHASYRTRFSVAGASEIAAASGTHLWILELTSDCRWRVAVVTWSVW